VRASTSKKVANAVLVRTEDRFDLFDASWIPAFIHVVDSTALRIRATLSLSATPQKPKSPDTKESSKMPSQSGAV
jgi:hypothetical protein